MRSVTVAFAAVLAATLSFPTHAAAPLSMATARVTVAGNSTLHPWSASSTAVTLTAVELAGTFEGDALEHALQPGALKTFDITIPALSLASSKEGIDKNMHKALKAQEHRDIRFRLRTLEKAGAAYTATGLLTIAGVEKEVTLDLQVQPKGTALLVTGGTGLVMTDYGITPPKAMMGMIKTDPKVQITIELTLGV
jgi:polyisoprenoid-binding protein YceI